MSAAKVVVVVLWLVLFSCFFIATGSTLSLIGRSAFWILIVTHVIECAAFFPSLRNAPGPLVGHLARTLIFGFFHLRDLRRLSGTDAPRS